LWKDHIQHLVSKISSLIGIIYRRRYLLPLQCNRNIYFALVYSHLVYGIEVYAKTFKSYLNPLIIKCNCLLRVLQNCPKKTKISELYRNFNTLPVDILFKLFSMKLLHRCQHDAKNVPSVIKNLFVLVNSIHSHNTRQSNCYFVSSDVNRQSISYIGPSNWYKLPSSLRECSSIYTFQNIYKLQLLNEL